MKNRLLLLTVLVLTASAADAAVIWKVSGRIFNQLATPPEDPRSVDYAAPVDVYLAFNPLAADSNPDPTRGVYAELTRVNLVVRGQLAPFSSFDRTFDPPPASTWLTVYNDALISGKYVDGIEVRTNDPAFVFTMAQPQGVPANSFSLSLLARSTAPGGGPLTSDQLPVSLDRSTFPPDPSLIPYNPFIEGCLVTCPDGGRMILSGITGGNGYFYEAVVDSITVVPVPAAAWLFGGALASLAGLRRRVPARAA